MAAPEGVMVPTEEFPPGIPFTCQVTAGFEAFCTFTKNCTVAPASICAEAGERLTVTIGIDARLAAALFDPVFPPQETCCVMAISASHLAMARICERGEALRTCGRERRSLRVRAELERADIESPSADGIRS